MTSSTPETAAPQAAPATAGRGAGPGKLLIYALWPPLFAAVIDVPVRWTRLSSFRGVDLGFYIFSLLLDYVAWLTLVSAVCALWPRYRRAVGVAVLLFAGVYAFLVVGTYSFARYFGVLPSPFTFEYIYEEPGDALANMSSGFSPLRILAMLLVAVAVVAYLGWPLRRGLPALRRLHGAGAGVLLLLLVPVFHNNVGVYPEAFLPEVQTGFALLRASTTAVLGRTSAVKLLSTPTRPHLAPLEQALPFDVLWVVNESLRAQNMGIYGYGRDTTPKMKRFLAEHAERAVLFSRAYANATRTMMAVASLLTGISPAQPASYLHTSPTVFDHAKRFAGTHTFFISAHSLAWANLDQFLSGPGIDLLWHKGNAEVPALNNAAVDDKYLPERFAAFLKDLPAGERYFGVLHFRSTHLGYFSSPEDTLWPSDAEVDRYDNAIHYLDSNVQKVIDLLASRGTLDQTLIFFTSDHGESLSEHGYSGHLHTFFDAETRVPLWILVPPKLASDPAFAGLKGNAAQAVCNLDLTPTLLALLGRASGLSLGEDDRLAGSDLTQPLGERDIIMQNHADISRRYMFGGVGVVSGTNKYLLRVEGAGAWEELYDLTRDPAELDNQWAKADPALRAHIAAALRRYPSSRYVFEKYGSHE